MHITWDEPYSPHYGTIPRPVTPTSILASSGHRKLHKSPKQVRFTPSTSGDDAGLSDPSPTPYTYTGLPTPGTTPEKHKEVKQYKKPSWMRWPATLRIANPDVKAQSTDPPSPTDSDQSWHHHESYYPEYEPIYPVAPSTAQPTAHPLTPAELQAQAHAARVGHAVAIHYPDLPAFAQYTLAGDKGKTGWQSGRYGTLGWNGFGWEEDRLPAPGQLTFGAPAPAGVPVEGAKKKKKKKKKKKGGAGGGGGGGGDDDEEGEEGGEGGEGEEGEDDG
ncbi:hypothetical protein IAU60_006531 [Kwoniella sp. DSM 27419]